MTGTDERKTLWNRLGAVCGILFAVLVIPGIVMSAPSGDPTEPATEIAKAAADGHTHVRVGIYLMLVGCFFFLVFLGYLYGYLRQVEGVEGWISNVAFGGGVAAAGVILVLAAIRLAATVVSDYGDDPEVAKVFVMLDWDFAGVLGPAFAALLAGTSVIGFRLGALPRALAWSGTVLATVLAFSGFYGGSLVAVSVLWILALSIVLLVRPGPARAAPHVPPDS